MKNVEIIFGAPGCGKTTYLLDILEKELKEYDPERIAFVSFTKKGAHEGLSRAMEKFDIEEKRYKYFRTLHSICFSELRMSRYDMLSKKDYLAFSKAMNMKFVGYYTEEFFHNDDMYLYLYFLKLNNYEMYKKIRDATQQNIKKIKHVALNYDGYKKHFHKKDFTDLLTNVINAKISLDIDVAIVDEAQDLTTLQWNTCQVLFAKAKKVYVAGDDDQAIYEWTGADVNYFLNLEGNRTILNKSWRLKSNLLDFAKRISGLIENRVNKNFDSAEQGGSISYYNTIKDFNFKDDETYYCLARNNYYLRRYKTELKKQLKIFKHKHTLSVDPDVVFAINHFNEYKQNQLADKDAIKITKVLRKDIVHIERLEWHEVFNLSQDDIFYYRKLIENKVEITEPKILVNTIHGVKGGEADNVILLMDITRVVHQQLYNLSDSELRVLYVACTRAKSNLHIVHAETKLSYAEVFKEINNEHNI
jgi:superfamily I DNA/RNA helicase